METRKMLADLAIDPEVTWRSFSRYELYREFIGRITEREARKPARSIFTQQVRLSFIRRVAWWVWGRANSSGFNITELPDSLILSLVGEVDATFDGVRRDLVAGSLLEKKSGDVYYFPHRSFLEFLVAEYLCIEEPTAHDLGYLANSITEEVRDFIKESGHVARVAQWRDGLENVPGAITSDLLSLVAWACNEVDTSRDLRVETRVTPRALLVDYFRLVERRVSVTSAADYLVSAFGTLAELRSRLACLVGLFLSELEASSPLRSALRTRIAAVVLSGCLKALKRFSDRSQGIEKHNCVDNPFMLLLFGGFRLAGVGREVTVDFGWLYREVSRMQSSRINIADLSEQYDFRRAKDVGEIEEIPFQELAQVDRRLALADEGAGIVRFLKRFPDPTVLLPTKRRYRT